MFKMAIKRLIKSFWKSGKGLAAPTYYYKFVRRTFFSPAICNLRVLDIRFSVCYVSIGLIQESLIRGGNNHAFYSKWRILFWSEYRMAQP